MSVHLSQETLRGHGRHMNMLWIMTSVAVLCCSWESNCPKAGFAFSPHRAGFGDVLEILLLRHYSWNNAVFFFFFFVSPFFFFFWWRCRPQCIFSLEDQILVAWIKESLGLLYHAPENTAEAETRVPETAQSQFQFVLLFASAEFCSFQLLLRILMRKTKQEKKKKNTKLYRNVSNWWTEKNIVSITILFPLNNFWCSLHRELMLFSGILQA